MARQVLYGTVTAAVLALLGLPLGWLWRSICPKVTYVVIQHHGFLANGETVGPIGQDGRFAVIGVAAGVICGVVGYILAGRDRGLAVLAGLGVGGSVGSVIAWLVGYLPGRAHFDHVIQTAADGRTITIPPDLGAKGVMVFWPLLAVLVFALLEAMDVARRHTYTLTGDAQRAHVENDAGQQGSDAVA